MLASVGSTLFRILTFQFTKAEVENFSYWHLAVGFILTWIVGVGRYWDHPKAEVFQYFGPGSVIYVLGLALYLYLVVLPLRSDTWSYRQLLTFITLTSPPAMLYALPVEKWFSLEMARTLNVWFLVIVATWRVGADSIYLRRYAGLRNFTQFAATFLPLSLIGVALAMLNLEHVVFQLMAGLRGNKDPASDAFLLLNLLAYGSYFISPFLVMYYVLAIVGRWKKDRLKVLPNPLRVQGSGKYTSFNNLAVYQSEVSIPKWFYWTPIN